ncbi:MAG: GNAT family N-acetyltransferase [Candidatus Zipacnadales bacterium]
MQSVLSRIRPARAEDVTSIAEIAKRAWEPIMRERGAVMGEDLMRRERGGDPLECKANEVRQFCASHAEWVLVTEVEGEVVGFITFVPHWVKGILEIGNNAIDPKWQGRGLGQAQYRYVLHWAREQGLKYAKVITGLDDCHAAARAAYEKVGFGRAIPAVTYYMEL